MKHPIEAFQKSEQRHLGRFEVCSMGRLAEQYPEHFEESGQMNWKWFEENIRPNHFIYVREDKGSITFQLQKGPRNEVGENGCDVDQMILAAAEMISYMNEGVYECKENFEAISYLMEARAALNRRKDRRKANGTAGYAQPDIVEGSDSGATDSLS